MALESSLNYTGWLFENHVALNEMTLLKRMVVLPFQIISEMVVIISKWPRSLNEFLLFELTRSILMVSVCLGYVTVTSLPFYLKHLGGGC